MKRIIGTLSIVTMVFIMLSVKSIEVATTYALTVKVNELQNSKGVVQFTLYNKDGTIPDEKFKKYYKQQIGSIRQNSSSITFKDLPMGKYAVNILHDENKNGKIDKGWVLPIEGIGFSNFKLVFMLGQTHPKPLR